MEPIRVYGVRTEGVAMNRQVAGQCFFLYILYMYNLYIYFTQKHSKYSKNTQNNDKTPQKHEKS